MDADVTVSVVALAALGTAALLLRRRSRPSDRLLSQLANGVARMRAAAERETKYQPVAADAIAKTPGAPYYDAAASEIQKNGCRLLGDLAEVSPDGTLTQPARWFVDGTATICGWYGIVGSAETPAVRQVMFLMSEAPGGEYFTTSRGGGGSGTASSPKHHLTECQWADGLERQLAVHRAQIPTAQPASLTHVATLDDATALSARSRKAKMAWRAQQPADSLLDQDLRRILQDRYPAVGAALLSYMRQRPGGS